MQGFKDSQKENEMLEMKKQAENAVAVAVASAAVIGVTPIPFADAPLLIATQVTMMATISSIYKIDVGKDGLKILATTVLGACGGGLMGRAIATNLLKCIPFGGQLVGGFISGATAATITLSMGNAFIAVCKKVKLGELIVSDITSEKGVSYIVGEFKEQMKKNNK